MGCSTLRGGGSNGLHMVPALVGGLITVITITIVNVSIITISMTMIIVLTIVIIIASISN